MPITTADLTYPTGEVRAEWFPGEVLSDTLATWIAAGYQNATNAGITDDAARDTVAEAYAYWRSFRSVAARLAGSPNSVAVEDLSRSVGKDRVEYFASEARKWENLYEDAIAEGQTETPVVSAPYASRSIPNKFVW